MAVNVELANENKISYGWSVAHRLLEGLRVWSSQRDDRSSSLQTQGYVLDGGVHTNPD